jgi:transcriptional regulator with XRE-family HTH domain
MAKVKARFKTGHPRHFIREWRKFRGLTLERLAERIDVTAGAVSQLERGDTNYTQPMLEALADALQTTPGALVSWPPEKDPNLQATMPSGPKSVLRALADEISDADATRVMEMARIMLRTGTSG